MELLNEKKIQIPGNVSLVSDNATVKSTQSSNDNQLQQQMYYIKKPAKLKGLNPAFVKRDVEFTHQQLDKVIMVTKTGEIVKLSNNSDELKKFINFSNINRENHDLNENQLLSKFNETKLFKVKKSNSDLIPNFKNKKKTLNDILSRDLLKTGNLQKPHRKTNRKRRLACIKSGNDLKHKRLSHKKHQRHTLEEIIKIYRYSNQIEFNSSSTLNYYHHGNDKKSGQKCINYPPPVKRTIGCQTQKEFLKKFPSRRRRKKQIKFIKPLLQSVSCQTSFRNLKKKKRLMVCPIENGFEQNNQPCKNDCCSFNNKNVNNNKKSEDHHYLLKNKSPKIFRTSKSSNLKVLYRNDHKIDLNLSSSSCRSSVVSLSDAGYDIENEIPASLLNEDDDISKNFSLSIHLNQSMKSCQSETTQVSLPYDSEQSDRVTKNERMLINNFQHNPKIKECNQMKTLKRKSHKMENYKLGKLSQYSLTEIYKQIQNYWLLLPKVNLSQNLIFAQYLPLFILILSIMWLIHSVLTITFPIEFLQFGFRYIYTLPFHLLKRKTSKWEILLDVRKHN